MTARSVPVSAEPRFFRWVVELEVEESWVEDGFDLTDKKVHQILANTLPYAYGHELRGRVLERPPDEEVALTQGMTVEEYLERAGS